MPQPTTDLIGAAEAAEILDVARSTISRWAENGRLRVAYRMPGETGALVFDRADVLALLDPAAGETVA